ncbi:hypothetical protein DUNSADRAFT_6496 [Dunaliella salina]|uniref:Uncharacterized protein n=1 Tax=Dunaliella salina TaxID=3046 RepID=A0ABQ7GNA1_DUNSA|nr:hypothetical protein DUNSADRAFT_6496 [Dunaliella salina]|eukprot:KAF5836076.1 hypothetical protein DUNSADRAFT_6496 [Dunaliella salina]
MLVSRNFSPPVHQGPQVPSSGKLMLVSAPALRQPTASTSMPSSTPRISRILAAAGKSNEQEATQPSSSTSSAASPKAEAALQAMTNTSTSSKDASGSGVAELARGMLLGDKETAEQMRRYEEALARLEANKAAAAELERIFADVSGARSAAGKQLQCVF